MLEFHTGISCCDKRLSMTNLSFTEILKSEVSSLLLRFVSLPSWPPSFLLHQGETAKCRNAWETLEKMLPTKQQNEVQVAMQPGGIGLLFFPWLIILQDWTGRGKRSEVSSYAVLKFYLNILHNIVGKIWFV